MNAVEVTLMPAPAERRWRAPAIVALYSLGFFGALPWLLWQLGARFDVLLRLPSLSQRWSHQLGVVEAVLGAAWMLLAMLALLVRGRGLPISHLPPVKLVGRGPYALSRHPIYVGYTALLSGLGLSMGSLGRGVLAPLLLTAAWITYVIGFEEPRLTARFGDAYRGYREGAPLVPLPFASALSRGALATWFWLRPACERLANRTVLFGVGSSLWVTYGALVALGAVVAATLNAALLAGLGLSARSIGLFQLGLTIAMLIGGRVAWLVYEWRAVRRQPRMLLFRVGFVSFGGYAGLLLFTFAFARWTGLDVGALFDRTLPVGLSISVFGRLGCLSYGCCYGKPCAHGLRWFALSAKVNRERGLAGLAPRVPTPLLSALVALVAACAGQLALLHGCAAGAASLTSALTYTVLRFGVECSRDEARFTPWQLTRGQCVALAAAPLVCALWFVLPAEGTVAALVCDWYSLGAYWPALLSIAALAFAVCGYHRNEVGRW